VDIIIKTIPKKKAALKNNTHEFRSEIAELVETTQVIKVTDVNHRELYLMKVSRNFFLDLQHEILYKFSGHKECLHHNNVDELKINAWSLVESTITVS